MLRFTRFKPTRRFWSVCWARRTDDGSICGVGIAARQRGLLIDWYEPGRS